MNNDHWRQFYQPPASPLARLAMVLVGIGTLALSFMLGLVVLAIAMGLALVAALGLALRRLIAGKPEPGAGDSGPINVEYRVIRRERRDDTPD